MSASEKIRQAIAQQSPGTVFSSADFLSAGTRAAVDQALFRLMKAGTIVRVARGLYAAASQPVETRAVASALARKSQRKAHLAASPKGRVLLALWAEGMKNLTTLDIQRATDDWLEVEIDRYAALIPAWLFTAIRQANASRKSVKIGLSGAYDWSNPNIGDDVLISKVLERHKFEDVARLCLYYGLPKVKRVFKRQAFEPMALATVARMLSNISKGLRASREQADA